MASGETVPVPITSQPGIRRDGTAFDTGDFYADGEHVRFAPKPRKMLGRRSVNKFLAGLARTLHAYTQDLQTYIHAGSADLVEQFFIDSDLNCSLIVNRTPTSGFTADDLNMWQFDVLNDGVTSTLVAQVAPNLACICNSDGGELFSGGLFASTPLATVAALPATYSASGGIAVLHPYVVAFGSNGFVMWSVPGQVDFTGSGAGFANVTQQKIVRILPIRGGSGPAGLVWSTDSLLQMNYIGGTATWQFTTLSGESSILSAASVVEYDGIYYWVGADRFLSFNGVVREVPNNLNLDFFFNHLNLAQRQKVFAYKVPRFGEIWWCFPKDDSEEPNHAVIYNVRYNTWYDTPLPNDGRGAGIFPAVFRRPMMSGVEPQDYMASAAALSLGGAGYTVGDVLTVVGGDGSIATQLTVVTAPAGVVATVNITRAGAYVTAPTNPVSVTGGTGAGAKFNLTYIAPYKFWVHETGVNEVDGLEERPIRSFFETADMSLATLAQANSATEVVYIEPDFVQTGDMSVQIKGRANARAPDVASDAQSFPDVATSANDQIVFLKDQRRQLRFRFESDTVHGYYEMGVPLAQVAPGDGRLTA